MPLLQRVANLLGRGATTAEEELPQHSQREESRETIIEDDTNNINNTINEQPNINSDTNERQNASVQQGRTYASAVGRAHVRNSANYQMDGDHRVGLIAAVEKLVAQRSLPADDEVLADMMRRELPFYDPKLHQGEPHHRQAVLVITCSQSYNDYDAVMAMEPYENVKALKQCVAVVAIADAARRSTHLFLLLHRQLSEGQTTYHFRVQLKPEFVRRVGSGPRRVWVPNSALAGMGGVAAKAEKYLQATTVITPNKGDHSKFPYMYCARLTHKEFAGDVGRLGFIHEATEQQRYEVAQLLHSKGVEVTFRNGAFHIYVTGLAANAAAILQEIEGKFPGRVHTLWYGKEKAKASPARNEFFVFLNPVGDQEMEPNLWPDLENFLKSKGIAFRKPMARNGGKQRYCIAVDETAARSLHDEPMFNKCYIWNCQVMERAKRVLREQECEARIQRIWALHRRADGDETLPPPVAEQSDIIVSCTVTPPTTASRVHQAAPGTAVQAPSNTPLARSRTVVTSAPSQLQQPQAPQSSTPQPPIID